MIIERVLDQRRCEHLADYEERGGGRGLRDARAVDPAAVVATITDAGLRGRGGAGFPSGVKWQTVLDVGAPPGSIPVVVNAAEGEPGSFKDRELIRVNPFKVLEGALIAAAVVGATEVIVALKASFGTEIDRLADAIDELESAGWVDRGVIGLVLGPSQYLFGEETGLLEVIDGRPPFPRVTPPYRRGIDALPRSPATQAEVGRSFAGAHSLAPANGFDEDSPAVLVNNVETFANVPGIIVNGPDWFREVGTAESPGTLVCTIGGCTRRHAVGEVPMGTSLAEAIELIGSGPEADRTFVAAMSGVANAVVPAALFDTPLSYEGMAAIGSGLGAGGFIMFDDDTDLAAVARGVSRFLAVESCGQCSPCKGDGLAISDDLGTIVDGNATPQTFEHLDRLLDSVTVGARCNLAHQQPAVVRSLLELFPGAFERSGAAADGEVEPIGPIADLVDGRASISQAALDKNPDWSRGGEDSGKWPAASITALHAGAAPSEEDPQAVAEPVPVAENSIGDEFDPIVATHRTLVRLLGDAGAADAEGRDRILDTLQRVLRRHANVTQRVLYPMVRRAAGDAGEVAGDAGRHDERRALALLRARPEPVGDDFLARLGEEVDVQIRDDTERVIPLLRATLSPDALREFGDALDEAALLTPDLPAP